MGKGAGHFSFYSVQVALVTAVILCVAGCSGYFLKDPGKQETLFRKLSTGQTAVQFSNTLYETDTFNSLFYEYYFNGAGLAIADVNNDGLSDIFLGGNMVKSRLYLNRGNLKFEDITGSAGIDTEGRWVTGVSMVDLNHDGWMDIYVCVGGNIVGDYRNLLYINRGAVTGVSFTEEAETAGLDDNGYSTQAAFFDYDRDGDLDMYLVTSSMKIPNKNAVRNRSPDGSMINTDRLYRNEGVEPGGNIPFFRNVSAEAGIVWDGFGLGITISDINRDGWPDVYVANDYISTDLLYINQKDGSFREMIGTYFKHLSYSAMGMDISDFNNDGLVDVFTLDMLPEDYFRKRIMAGNMRDYQRYTVEQDAGYSRQYIRNMLQLNNGEIDGRYSFSEIGQLAGVFETDWSWAPLFADFDNDGWKDLFIGNGIPQDLTNMDFAALWQNKMRENPDMPFSILGKILMEDLKKRGNVKKPNVVFRNGGNLFFENKTLSWGLDQPSYSTGSAFADLDNDGDLDLVMNNINDPAFVYENTLSERKDTDSLRHFLRISLAGSRLNPGGIGSKILLYHNESIQYYEHFPVRGFQSMIDPVIHFGLGRHHKIDSLKITWPDQKQEILYEVQADQLLMLDYRNASQKDHETVQKEQPVLFKEAGNLYGIDYIHEEKEFIDFKIQPLVPHLYSREGPGIAVGDVNGDGMDDFIAGGATGSPAMVFTQQSSGKFTSAPLPENPNFENMGILLFDADADGDNDLYVVNGGTGLPPGNPYYTDRFYSNDGSGNFTLLRDAIPDYRICGSQVTASDYDQDGDLDLFVCGRVLLEEYPMPVRSFLLRNDSESGDKIHFTDVTAEAGPALEKPGLITSALWTDYNIDGWIDLMLTGEWMSPRLFRNLNGKLTEVTDESGLAEYTGWWNSIAAADFDRDGDIDYVMGNLGLNTRFKVSQEEPMQVFARDFDMNGQIDPVCSYYVQGKRYPIYHRNILINQIPVLQKSYATYEEYASATLTDIFGEEPLQDAYQAACTYFNSAFFENQGDGTFRVEPLPAEAQFAPVFGILTGDYNADGNPDILLTGNSHSFNVEDGQFDAFTGLVLTGDGQGSFTPVLSRNSGFYVDGDAKGMAELVLADGQRLIMAAQNSGKLKVFEQQTQLPGLIRLNRDDAYAEISFANGRTERREFYYGSGYLSCSSRILYIPLQADKVRITSSSGETRNFTLTQIPVVNNE